MLIASLDPVKYPLRGVFGEIEIEVGTLKSPKEGDVFMFVDQQRQLASGSIVAGIANFLLYSSSPGKQSCQWCTLVFTLWSRISRCS